MSFRDVVENVIGMAEAAKLETVQRHLDALEEPVVRKLLVVMYAGRGDGNFTSAFEEEMLGAAPRAADAVGMMLGKSRLAEYLRAGLARAASEGVDLEPGRAATRTVAA